MDKKIFKRLISMTLMVAFIMSVLAASVDASVVGGTQTGRAYLWKYSTGQQYYYTIADGTYITDTGTTANGRTYVICNGQYGWVTSYLVKPDNYYRSYSYNYSYTPYYAGYISGMTTGNAYFWKYSTGQQYYYLVSSGTKVTYIGGTSNGRTYVELSNGGCGWITSRFVHYY